jgi:hypothetical protein
MLSILPTVPKTINEMVTELRNISLMSLIKNAVEDILLVVRSSLKITIFK